MRQIPKRLSDIISTDEFLVSLLEAAKISGRNESSFRVYGDRKGYSFTEPMEEESTSCLAGVDRHGVVYHVEGQGLHLPRHKSSIVDVHFHPKNSLAMPSPRDFGGTFTDYVNNRKQAFSNMSPIDYKYFIPTSIVGWKSRKGIDLFVYQPKEMDIDNFDVDFFHEAFDDKFRDDKGSLILKVKGEKDSLPKRFAAALEDTGKYLARNFHFSGKGDYLKVLKELNGFQLMKEMEFKDATEEVISGPVHPAEDFNTIDIEEELRREHFF